MEVDHLAHDLFLLMINLSQLKNTQRIISVFVEAVNALNLGVDFYFEQRGENLSGYPSVPITTATHTYGYLSPKTNPHLISKDRWALLSNASRMLALFIEKRQQEQYLADEKLRLEQAVSERTAEILQMNTILKDKIQQLEKTEKVLRQQQLVTSLLNKASQVFSSSLKLDEVLAAILMEVRSLLNIVATSIWLVDTETGELICQQSVGPQSNRVKGWRIDPDEGFVGWTVMHNQSLLVNDSWNDERHYLKMDNETGLELRSILSVPLRVKNKVTGVLQVMDKEIGRFNETDQSILESLAISAAIAIENASLYERAQNEIVERKRMEAALRKSEEALKVLNEELENRVKERTAQLSKTNIVLQREIDERRQIQAELELARDQAEAANRAKSEFLANMSHELRTPLNGILGFTQILKRDPHLSQEHRQRLDIIYRSGEHLLSLINDILDLSKIEAGRVELNPSPFAFPDFILNVTSIIQIRAELKGVDFHCTLSEKPLPVPGEDPPMENWQTLPSGIISDELKLRQVLLNLLGNAVKFTPTGQINFQLGCYRSSPDTDARIRFLIQDSGVGIKSENLESIFDSFHQAGEFHTRQGGTGLGLAISQKLVQLMGSQIHVHSEVGKGSTFWFDLPVKIPSDLPVQPNAIDNAVVGFIRQKVEEPNPPRLLIVDDSQENRSLLQDILAPLGFEMDEAIDGAECIDKITSFQPHLILLDLWMPNLDGFQTARKIRELGQTQPDRFPVLPRIIAISANAFPETRAQSLAAGCDRFISKPFQTNQLLQLIGDLLPITWITKKTVSEKNEWEQSDLETIPKTNREAILRFSQIGDAKRIYAQIEQLRNNSDVATPILELIHKHVRHFDFDKIIKIFKQGS